MNLRQKNKKLKQENEKLKQDLEWCKRVMRPDTIQLITDKYDIKTYSARKEFTEEQLNFFDIGDIIQILADEMEPAIVSNLRIRTSESGTYYGNKLFTGEITLAIPKG